MAFLQADKPVSQQDLLIASQPDSRYCRNQ